MRHGHTPRDIYRFLGIVRLPRSRIMALVALMPKSNHINALLNDTDLSYDQTMLGTYFWKKEKEHDECVTIFSKVSKFSQ